MNDDSLFRRDLKTMEENNRKFFGPKGVTNVVENKPLLKIVGKDGNAFNLLGLAHRVAQKAGWPDARWQEVKIKAMNGNYDHLLAVLMENFDVR